jgi:hypothetical protein
MTSVNRMFRLAFVVMPPPPFLRCHDTHLNDIQHNDTQHKGFICDTQHKQHSAQMTLRITTMCIECHYSNGLHAECRVSFAVMLDVIMLSVVMVSLISFSVMQSAKILSVILLNVIMLSDVAPVLKTIVRSS